MKYFYVVLIILVVYVGFVLIRFKYQLNHIAVLPEIKQNDRTTGTGPVLKYFAAGDSTANGEGASDVSKTYTYKVADYLDQKHTVEYKNSGVLGAQTQDVIDDQLSQIIEFQPDVVTISIGANDMTHFKSNDLIMANYKRIMGELINKTNAKIYITDVPNVSDGQILPYLYRVILRYKTNAVNRRILALESDRVKVIDIQHFGWDKFDDLQTTYAADNFHPNDIGYQNWTDAFLDKIQKDY